MIFEPYSEGPDEFEMTFAEFSSRLHIDRESGHQKFLPAPDEKLLDRFYNGTFIRSADGVVSPELEYTPKVMAFAEDLRSRAKTCGVPSDFLAFDVGCGFGALVHAFRQMGIEAFGNEANRSWVEAANPYCENRLSTEPLEDTLERLGKKIDLFSIYHVLEHLIDPLATLKIVARHLSDVGIVDIQVPNAHSSRVMVRGRRCDPQYHFPQHLHYFSPRSLIEMVREAGLEPISLATRPLFENGYDDTAAGWEAAMGISKELSVDADAWAKAAGANLLAGELLVVAVLPTNKTALRQSQINERADKALRAFAAGRAEAQKRCDSAAATSSAAAAVVSVDVEDEHPARTLADHLRRFRMELRKRLGKVVAV